MSRPRVEFLRLDGVALAPSPAPAFGHGLRAAVLSAQPGESGASTLLVQAEPWWCSHDGGALESDLEILLLEGDLRIGDCGFARGSYAFLPSGLPLDGAESRSGFTALWMREGRSGLSRDSDPAAAYEEGRRVGPLDVNAQAWQPVPDFPGRTSEEAGSGLKVRRLRSDPDTGAYTLMTYQESGWSDPRLEAHETWEELVLLQGDYLMGETGMITSGSYIFRPGEKPHGPQATRGGCVWFCRGEKEIDFRFTQPDWTAPRCREYLAQPAPDPQPQLWGNWSS
ncbi:MAG: DUF4437 domain-containing protein [Gammaproteobacteria bacterium]|nr:DUF4437 domain-containing protein [Gammaproteobacteria bacterium]